MRMNPGGVRAASPGQNKVATVPTRRPLVVVASEVEPLSPPRRASSRAAKQLLAEKGFSAVTLEAIAADAGVNKAATRYHFGSKAGLSRRSSTRSSSTSARPWHTT